MLDPHPTSQAEIRSARPPGDFEAMVAAATERIEAGEMRKVVLAREVVVSSPAAHDPAALFGAMREQFPSCFCFCCGTPEAAFFGASPELLVRRSGASVSTVALAGSTRRSSDPAVDDHLGEQLLRSDKNRREQRIVSERIVRTLRPHSVWVEAAAEPEVIKVANIQHLATPVIAQLAEPRSAVELAGLLHPTPAVGGEPRERGDRRDRRARGDGPRLVRRPGRLDGRDRGRRVLRRPAQRPAARPRGPPLRRRRRRRRLRPGGRARRDRDQAPGAAAAAGEEGRGPSRSNSGEAPARTSRPSVSERRRAPEIRSLRGGGAVRRSLAVDRDLDQAGAGGERVGELGERVERAVGEAEEVGRLGGADPARGAEQGLELRAVERLGLRQELEDAAAVVVDDDDPHRGRRRRAARRARRGRGGGRGRR